MKRFLVGLLALIGGLVVFCSLAIIFLAKNALNETHTVNPNTVLLIEFSGETVEHARQQGLSKLLGQKSDSLYHLVQAIDQASKDPKVKGIVARIDFASMGIAQAQELRNAIMRFRVLGRDSNKFTIAHADTFGESGQGTIPFYLASVFEEIWMQPLGTVSMTGLQVEIPFAKTALDTIGITPRIGKREEYKSAMDSITENGLTKPNKEALKTLLNSIMNQVVRDIALARELNEVDVWDAVNKGPLLGSEALKQGIIDRQDYFDEMHNYVNSKVKGEVSFMKPAHYLEANPLPLPQKGKNKIALIYGNGAIARASGNALSDDGITSAHVKKAFEAATKDEDVVAIVFRINSPGGSPVASETILRAARKAQQAGKPVIVSMSDVAGSGGYWIAAYADQIVAHPSTITGSIGVIGGKLITKDAWAKIGVKWESVSVGENASMWSSTEDFSTHGWERLQSYLDSIYKGFIDRVAEGRDLPREHVMEIAKGRIWSGEDALKFKLVDKLGDLREAIEIAKESVSLKDQTLPVEIFPKPQGLGSQIQSVLFGEDDSFSAESNPALATLQGLYTMYVEVKTFLGFSSSTVAMDIKQIKG